MSRSRRNEGKEGFMWNRARGLRLRGVIAAAVAVAVVLPVAGLASGSRAAACGTVVLNEQAWAGSTANTYVAKAVLEKTFPELDLLIVRQYVVEPVVGDGKGSAEFSDIEEVHGVPLVCRGTEVGGHRMLHCIVSLTDWGSR